MWRWYTAEDRRQAAATGALLLVLGVTAMVLAPVIAGLTIVTLTAGDAADTVGLSNWPMITIGLWRHPGEPATAFGVDHLSPVMFWTVALAMMIITGAAWWVFATHVYQLLAPTGTGFASRHDIAHELSGVACRRRAAVTRPDLTRRQLRQAPLPQVGIPLHQAAVSRTPLWLPLENATG